MPTNNRSFHIPWLHRIRQDLLCRGCLGPIGPGAEAGLCEACWEGLHPLAPNRCPRCALDHPGETPCPEPVGWSFGDACWDYHGGRPALGALLVPGIKQGELGWRRALLRKLEATPLPDFAWTAESVIPVPTAPHRRWWRGFDLAEDLARHAATRLGCPCRNLLHRRIWSPRQSGRTESARRRLPQSAILARRTDPIRGATLLLVDDVWTTGTTLLRCAQALKAAGAADVRVLALFRAT